MSVARAAAETHDYIYEHGFLCSDCDHRHTGAALGFICIGCECALRCPSMDDFARMRSVIFEPDDPPQLCPRCGSEKWTRDGDVERCADCGK